MLTSCDQKELPPYTAHVTDDTIDGVVTRAAEGGASHTDTPWSMNTLCQCGQA